MFIAQAKTLAPLPVNPSSAKQPLFREVPVKLPVPEFSGQPVHAAAPVAALKWSAKQASKGPPSGPVYPAFATQAVAAVEAIAAPVAELTGQLLQAVAEVSAAL